MMTYGLQFLGAFVATVGFAIFFNAPRKILPWVGLVGAIGWILSVLLIQNDTGSAWAYMIASMAVAFIAEVLAVRTKNPSTLFSIPGIYPLVPGYGLYQTMYYFTIHDVSLAAQTLLQTLGNAGAIALGIIVITSLSSIRKKWINNKQTDKKQKEKELEDSYSIFE